MKTTKTIIFLLISLIAMQVSAQISIQPFDSTIDFDKARRPCLQVNLDPEPKTLKNAWKDYLKDNYDFKLKGIGFLSNKDLLSAEAITVKQISSDAMDFYTHIVEDENGSEMKVFARHGYDIYINDKDYPNEYKVLREILESFIKYYLPIYYNTRLDDIEERVSDLTEERNDLRENINDNAEEIEKLKKEIKEKEEEAIANNKKLEIAERKLIKRKAKLLKIKAQLKKL